MSGALEFPNQPSKSTDLDLSKLILKPSDLTHGLCVRRVSVLFGCICRPDIIVGYPKMDRGVWKVELESSDRWVEFDVLGVSSSSNSTMPKRFLIPAGLTQRQFNILRTVYPGLVLERSTCIYHKRSRA